MLEQNIADILKKDIESLGLFHLGDRNFWGFLFKAYNYLQAKQLGCHIITIPPTVIEKIEKFGKSFNQLTIETVKAFLVDSKKSNFKI